MAKAGSGVFLKKRRPVAPTEPQPPSDVRVIMADGREIPVECVYAGTRDGLHEWVAVHRLAEVPIAVGAGALPPRTTIRVSCARPV